MKAIRTALLAFFFTTTISFLWAYDLYLPDQVEQGNVLRAIVYPAGNAQEVSLELLTPEGKRAVAAHGFLVRTVRDVSTWVVLAGVPSTAQSGTYAVHLSVTDSSEVVELNGSVEVAPRSFVHEDIALNDSMSTLRSEQNARKAREARELANLLAQFDPEAVYQEGSYEIPVPQARESAFFGDRRRYLYAQGGSAGGIHFGLDLAVPTGTEVAAGAPGKVVFASRRLLTGNTIVVENLPGVFSLYYHLHSIRVSPGTLVHPDTVIGTVGATGLVTGPHLHWEIRASEVPVEPKSLLDRRLVDRHEIFRIIMQEPEG